MFHSSHYAFRQKLKCKGEEYSTHIHEVGEEYTTKCCGECGRIDETIGGKRYADAKLVPMSPIATAEARTICLKTIEAYVGVFDFSALLRRNISA